MSNPSTMTLTDHDFVAQVLDVRELVLVDFCAPWVGSCRGLEPAIDRVAVDYLGRIKVGRMDVVDNRRMAMVFGVLSLPTLILFKAGRAVEQLVGAPLRVQIEAMIERHLPRRA